MRLALAVVDRARRSPRRRSRSTRPTRRRTSPRPTSGRRSTRRPSTRRCWRRSAPPTSPRRSQQQAGRPRALVRGPEPVLELGRGLRGRRAALRLGGQGLRPRPADAVHRPQRRDAVRAHLVDGERARQAARRGDHQRLRAGARDAVLVRRPDAGQGRLRGDDLRPAEPGPLGPDGGGRRRAGGLPRPDRRAPVLRRRPGRAGLLPLHPRRALRAAPELQLGHEPRAEAAAPRARRAQRRLQPAVRADRPGADRHRRALLRRRGRLLRRPARPAREGRRGVGRAARSPTADGVGGPIGPCADPPSAPRRRSPSRR